MQVFPSQFEPRFPAQRQMPALLLVLAVHILFWQAWQHQRQQHQTQANTVQYLDLFQVNPVKPAAILAVKAIPPSTTPAVTTTVKTRPSSHSQSRPEPASANKTETSPVFPVVTETEAAQPLTTGEASAVTGPGLDQLRKSGLQIDKEMQKGTIAQIQASHLRKDTLETDLAKGAKKAERKDCRNAFAGLGLLALVPLAASTVTDLGCKW